jgi:hypothetical protein
MVAALIVSSPVMAQSRIDKIIDELEQKGVDASKVVKRDPKTKKPYSIVKSLTFYSKDGNYANRLKEAFRKDAEDAVEEKVERKGNSYRLVFVDGKKRATYSLDIQERQEKDPRVDLRIVIRDGNVKELDTFEGLMENFGSRVIEDTIFLNNGNWYIQKSFDAINNKALDKVKKQTEEAKEEAIKKAEELRRIMKELKNKG